jgi:hypothetical protein
MSNANDATTTLLQKLQNGEITLEDCQKELKTKKSDSSVTYKVSTKGCISFYGIRRMPISLYKQELEAILSTILNIDDTETVEIPYNEIFQAFLDDNEGKISVKD